VIISVPVWGDFHRSMFRNLSYPSYRDQMRPGDRLIVHGEPVDGIDAEYLPVPTGKGHYERAATAHKQAIRIACGEPIVFVPPDNILSANALDAIRVRLDEGNQLVAACSIRVSEGAPWPRAFDPRSLIKWALQHPHEITRRSVWGNPVTSTCPSINLFRTDWGAVARCFHLHPLAMRTTNTNFTGTIDGSLMAAFPVAKVHVVTDSDELAVVEVSPDDKAVGEPRHRPITLDDLAQFRRHKVSPMHEFFFEHRICLKAREFHET
jgi:hypothetical protein